MKRRDPRGRAAERTNNVDGRLWVCWDDEEPFVEVEATEDAVSGLTGERLALERLYMSTPSRVPYSHIDSKASMIPVLFHPPALWLMKGQTVSSVSISSLHDLY